MPGILHLLVVAVKEGLDLRLCVKVVRIDGYLRGAVLRRKSKQREI